VICTYNPPKNRLKLVLESILKQDLASCEIILIDNNSSTSEIEHLVEELNLSLNASIHFFKENKQGLAFARLKGAHIAKGKWIVFVDDDNILQENYIKSLKEIDSRHPECSCWGPGIIEVQFEEKTDSYIEKYCKSYFQYKRIKGSPHDNSKTWKEFYPTGSGMCVKKDSFQVYAKKFEEGIIKLTGRKGLELSSGEDAQIIFTCIILGHKVGTFEKLQLTHVIGSQRCNLHYLKKLNFSISRDFYLSHWEIFNDKEIFNEKPGLTLQFKLLLKSISKTFPNLFSGIKIFRIDREWIRGYYEAKKIQELSYYSK
jgi:glycosyltransferase involved in cell wall biosynthesis